VGSQQMSIALHRSPNKLWRSNSIYNLWVKYCTCIRGLKLPPQDWFLIGRSRVRKILTVKENPVDVVITYCGGGGGERGRWTDPHLL